MVVGDMLTIGRSWYTIIWSGINQLRMKPVDEGFQGVLPDALRKRWVSGASDEWESLECESDGDDNNREDKMAKQDKSDGKDESDEKQDYVQAFEWDSDSEFDCMASSGYSPSDDDTLDYPAWSASASASD
ncbi:hypothetical protein BO71DRAFT_481618 [Aspergillus ellipticus CBS 707.79]|uniref:Uncharacterized protein n=1 Tax=Aspergillus ellipticus CBS 707.79 TaxID=1448320 RepID=A0A319E8C7_9EURO|nr:hypothetical protein BO71DRAFT_481618 [Aspergillus ellipticus CBS 707.79]